MLYVIYITTFTLKTSWKIDNLKVSQDLTLLLNFILMVRESKTEIVASEIR
jgi:hypothetical protein